MEKESNLNIELLDSISSKESVDLAGDIAEIGIDSLLDEGLLKDIPFFGTAIKAFSIISSVRDRLFLKKVSKFLFELSKINEQQRSDFREKIRDDKDFQSNVGENLILLLERHENMSKPSILAKAFGAFIKEEMCYDEFLKIAAAIDSTFINDLLNLPTYYENIDDINFETGERLYKSGLVNISHAIDGIIDESKSPMGYTIAKYSKNELGNKLSFLINKIQT